MELRKRSSPNLKKDSDDEEILPTHIKYEEKKETKHSSLWKKFIFGWLIYTCAFLKNCFTRLSKYDKKGIYLKWKTIFSRLFIITHEISVTLIQKIKQKHMEIKNSISNLQTIDRESSIGTKSPETLLQVKLKTMWLFYRNNIKYTFITTLVMILLLLKLSSHILSIEEIIIKDKQGNVIENPFIFKINNEIHLPNHHFKTLTLDEKWYDKEAEELKSDDFKRGYYEAQVYMQGFMNITFNQTRELLLHRCKDVDTCSCSALSQFGINKKIFFIKSETPVEEDLFIYGLDVIKHSNSYISTIVKLKKEKEVKAPSSFLLEYLNENNKKVILTTSSPIQAICIQTFLEMIDSSYYS